MVEYVHFTLEKVMVDFTPWNRFTLWNNSESLQKTLVLKLNISSSPRILGSLSNDDGDGNDNTAKQKA